MTSSAEPLPFHPLINAWFRARYGEATPIQACAWEAIARGSHVLMTAPTGSGKTLAAFLWALDRLLTGVWSGGSTRLLYVSPLKALNHDIERNLIAPLDELEAAWRETGAEPLPVRVATRSGDTPSSERRKMARRPPEILITTPESLNILLTSVGGRRVLADVKAVILDEIHAVAANKRGTHLMTAVERLDALAGPVQRIALSATVEPLAEIARFVAGFEIVEARRQGSEPRYRPRPIEILKTPSVKRYELEIAAPRGAWEEEEQGASDTFWSALISDLKRHIVANRSTLIFANSRRLTEKVTRLINEGEAPPLAYSHHGSLSREIRQVVEERLKQGRLKAIVATSSLELGIDIGAIDEVLLLSTPSSVASGLQRIGRAGHAVGEVSRGSLYPMHPRDFLEAAAVARAVVAQEVEEISPPQAPLDVLAQVMLSMTATETWNIDELFDLVRSSWPYHALSRRDFDRVLDMLAGRYASARLRELEARVVVDRIDGTVRARPGVARMLYASGGTIPERGYFALRLETSGAKLGELDEEFVWERSIGDTFTLGAQSWRIRQITHNDVLVVPSPRGASLAPFWRGEDQSRSFELSSRIADFLEAVEGHLATEKGSARLSTWLATDAGLGTEAALPLARLLARQFEATGALPHRHRLVVERVKDGELGPGRKRLVFHTLWGGRVNRPWAVALAAAWRERYGVGLEVAHDDDAVMLIVPAATEARDILALVRPERLADLLRAGLERTGFFGARFRESAGRALLLPRADFRRRQPLWMIRERAKRLLAAVAESDDFPILLETWRSCLVDELDLPALATVLTEVGDGAVVVTEVTTERPSPFVSNLIWEQTNRLMYEDDTPDVDSTSLRQDLVKELVYLSELRPSIPPAAARELETKLQRTAPGFAPGDANELIAWLEERVLAPFSEWEDLLAAVERDGGTVDQWLDALARRLVILRLPGASETVVAALARLPAIARAVGLETAELELTALEEGHLPLADLLKDLSRLPSPEESDDPIADLVSEWLRFYGVVDPRRLGRVWGLDEGRIGSLCDEKVEEGEWVVDRLLAGSEEAEVIDAANLERLLRQMRRGARPAFEALGADWLPLFLALHQGLGGRAEERDGGAIEGALEPLFGYPAPAGAWEEALLPARLATYREAWLDRLLLDTELLWVGCGRQRLTFVLASDLDLVRDSSGRERQPSSGGAGSELLAVDGGRKSFDEIVAASGREPAALATELWRLAWRGEVSNTGFGAVRQGVERRFRPLELARDLERQGRPRARSRGRADRWRANRPLPGDWFRLPAGEPAPPDPLEREEEGKERARLLLDRYGVVFRELLAHELPAFSWSAVFRALRLMELSGEVLAGHFFAGVRGLQFATHAAFQRLREGLPRDVVFWLAAIDPASPVGLGVEGMSLEPPSRLPSNHLVFHGPRCVVVSRRNGSDLTIASALEAPRLSEYFDFMKVLLTREARPRRWLRVKTINGAPAGESPFAARLETLFSVTRDPKGLMLRRRYRTA